MQNINIEATENATITVNTPDGKKLSIDIVFNGDIDGTYWRDVFISRVYDDGYEQDLVYVEVQNHEKEDFNEVAVKTTDGDEYDYCYLIGPGDPMNR